MTPGRRSAVRDAGARGPEAGSLADLRPVDGRPGRLRLGKPVVAGWYLLRTTCRLPKASANGQVWLQTDGAAEPEMPRRLALRDGRAAMRLLHVPAAATLEFQPGPDGAQVLRFRLWRVPLTLGRYLVQRRLRLRHPGYAGLSQAALWRRPFGALWDDYNRLFDEPGTARLSYEDWIARHETPQRPSVPAQRVALSAWRATPRVLCLLASDPQADAHAIDVTRRSLAAQGYPHWELLPVGAPDATALADALARCDAVGFLQPGERLRDDALFQFAGALQHDPALQIVYSDHDRIDGGGLRRAPCFKPGFSRDLLYARNLLAPFALLRADAVRAAGGLAAAWRHGNAGAHTLAYVLLLAVLRQQPDAAVRRLPQILSHMPLGPQADAARDDAVALAALNAELAPAGARAEPIGPGLRRVRWPLPESRPLVSLIVPTRNGLDVLRTCIESIEQRTRYRPYELLVIDNQSDDPATLDYLAQLAREGRARVLRHDAPFNYSAINNRAAREARGSVIGLVNNDIEVISPGWLDEMVAQALRPEIGCVGAKLYFPDDTIQHAGVLLGIGGVAGHAHKYLPRDAAGHLDLLLLAHNLSAVTGATLLMRKAVFDEVGGLDEQELHVAYNDIDLCLRVMRAGYRNLWTPYAELYHHESKTRGADDTPAKLARWHAERAVMQSRWSAWIADDPFYSPHLSRTREDLSLDAPYTLPLLHKTDPCGS